MQPTNKDIIVIGGEHHNTLGVLRSLGRKGLNPIAIVMVGERVNCNILKTKYVHKYSKLTDAENCVETLINEYALNGEKKIVIACNDKISSAIDLNRDRLTPYFILPGCEQQGRVTEMMNKKKMGELAIEIGLKVPSSFVMTKEADVLQSNISFPCITKPVESRQGSKSQIKVCKTKEHLVSYMQQLESKQILIQEFINKNIEFQLIGCSLYEGHEIIIPGVSIILRQPSTTNTGFLHYTSIDTSFQQTIEQTKSFIKAIGYEGLFSVEFLRDKNGIDYFMEINFRNDGNAIAVTNAGVNLPYIWYLYATGGNWQAEIKPIHDEYVMPEFAELDLFGSKVISWRQMREDMRKASSYMDYDALDTAPTNGWNNYRKAMLKNIVKRLVKK